MELVLQYGRFREIKWCVRYNIIHYNYFLSFYRKFNLFMFINLFNKMVMKKLAKYAPGVGTGIFLVNNYPAFLHA